MLATLLFFLRWKHRSLSTEGVAGIEAVTLCRGRGSSQGCRGNGDSSTRACLLPMLGGMVPRRKLYPLLASERKEASGQTVPVHVRFQCGHTSAPRTHVPPWGSSRRVVQWQEVFHIVPQILWSINATENVGATVLLGLFSFHNRCGCGFDRVEPSDVANVNVSCCAINGSDVLSALEKSTGIPLPHQLLVNTIHFAVVHV